MAMVALNAYAVSCAMTMMQQETTANAAYTWGKAAGSFVNGVWKSQEYALWSMPSPMSLVYGSVKSPAAVATSAFQALTWD